MKRKGIFRKKTWWQKKVQKWTGRDMLAATGVLTLLTTALAGLPFVGILIKEKVD